MNSSIETTKMKICFAFTHQLCKAQRIVLKTKMNVQPNHKQLQLLFVAPVHLTIQNKQRITEFILSQIQNLRHSFLPVHSSQPIQATLTINEPEFLYVCQVLLKSLQTLLKRPLLQSQHLNFRYLPLFMKLCISNSTRLCTT